MWTVLLAAVLVVCVASHDGQRKIDGVASFGEYIRLLENEARWKKVKLSIDRGVFRTKLDKVREIRNDVMHFDPDGILPADLERLRDFAYFLQRLLNRRALAA